MQADQISGKTRAQFYGQWEVDEVGKVRDLARRLFGERGMCEQSEAYPGVLHIGVYAWRPRYRNGMMEALQGIPRELWLAGACYTDLLRQAEVVASTLGIRL